MTWDAALEHVLHTKRTQHAYRTRTAVTNGNQRYLHSNTRQYCNFASNDYLGLSHDPSLIAAWQKGATLYGLGSGGSGHITGYSAVHQALETQLADWLGYPRSLIVSSGYAANQALILGLMEKQDTLLLDRLCHASLLEAAHVCGAKTRRFKHNDMDNLASLMVHAIGKTLVASEGVFSMDGDRAPLSELSVVCRQHRAWLVLDDAHGIGAYGPQGRGSIGLTGIKPDILVVTFGKALGLSGAAILCNEVCADYLLQCARHLIYSTSVPIALAYTLMHAIDRVSQADELRQKLAENIAYFRQKAQGLPMLPSHTAIQPLSVGSNQMTLRMESALRDRGIWVSAIRPPSVPPNCARLRITLSAFHSQSDIDTLIEALDDCIHVH